MLLGSSEARGGAHCSAPHTTLRKYSMFKKYFYALFILFGLLTGGLFWYFKISVFVVLTDSMSPTAPKGSLIFVMPLDKISVGEVISYRYKGMKDHVVTHRVIDIVRRGGKDFYITKGDANSFADNPIVSKEEIVGRVFWIVKLAVP